jgi:hypothetical protein
MSVDMKVVDRVMSYYLGVRWRDCGQPRKHVVVTVLSKTGSENLTIK